MAWVFQLAAECGPNKGGAEVISDHFKTFRLVLSDGLESSCSVSLIPDNESNWWCLVTPNNVSKSGVKDEHDAEQLTELGYVLYQQLRACSTFRYALVGIEVELFRLYSELVNEESYMKFSGLVLSQDLWEVIGRPSEVEEFKPGYFWFPYQGEKFSK